MNFVADEFLPRERTVDHSQLITYILGKIRYMDSQSVEIRRQRISLYLEPFIILPNLILNSVNAIVNSNLHNFHFQHEK